MQNYNLGGGYPNPYLQRLNQLEQQYPQFAPQPQQVQMQQPHFRVLPVTNMDEANATQVAIDGTPTFFYNASKNEIYLKRISMNSGLAEFQKFVLTQSPTSNEKQCKCTNASEQQFKAINDKLDGLYLLLGNKEEVQPKKEVKNAKQ